MELHTVTSQDDFNLKSLAVASSTKKSRRRSSIVNVLSNDSTLDPFKTPDLALLETEQQLPIPLFGIHSPRRNKWRFISACLWSVLGGWNDGAPGCLLPYMELAYGLNYLKVSLIWIGSLLGFIAVLLGSHYINKFLNNQRIIVTSCVLMITMTLIISSGSKFPVIVVGFMIGGIGSLMGLSQLNVILSNFENCPKYLGIFHGSYGLGLTISPIIATVMLSNGVKWNYFYLIALGLMCCNIFNVFGAFQGIDDDLNEHGINNQKSSSTDEDIGVEANNRVKLALQNYQTWLISFFLLFYQGLEVALGGFIVSYMIDYRSGVESKIGYVASGYWGGLTLGRVFLVPIAAQKLGLKRGGLILSLIAMVFILLTWVVSNIILELVFISIAGVFIGPTYPLLIQVSTKILPRKIQIISLTIMSSFGSSGGAIFPFIVGLISDKFGSFVIFPVLLILYGLTMGCWVLLPNPEKNTKHWWDRVW